MVFIYVLQLKEEKWYIGKTEHSKFRIDTHFDTKGSCFTKKYPPEEIYQIIPECDKYDEDKYVKKYMDKYGIDNKLRMTGGCETADYNKFSYDVANRGTSIRIPRTVYLNKYGYIEDRRPGSNADPYNIYSIININI